MGSTNQISGHMQAPRGKIAIVASRFNEIIVDRLIAGAEETLIRHGMNTDQIEIFRVPGAYEIPLVCLQAAKTNRYIGVIALGTVIRGETSHYDFVAGGCANGILQAQLQTGVPMMFGVLTTENLEQGIARAGGTVGNKGAEAASGLIEMINLLGKINE